MKNKVINLLGLIKSDKDHPGSMTILPDYETAFILSLARAYDRAEVRPDEFLQRFYDNFEKYLVAVGGRGREDIKEVYTRREFFDQYMKSLYEKDKKDEGVRLA